MDSNRQDYRIFRDYIQSKGGTNVELELNHKHPRMYLNYRGVRKFVALSSSPSDANAIEMKKRDINSLFTYIIDITSDFIEEPKKEEIKNEPALKVPSTFGERLQFAREQQQLSRERLAELSSIDEDVIQRYEVTKQEHIEDFTTALLLSSALNLSLSYLVGEKTAKEFKPMTAIGDAISKARNDKHIALGDLARRVGLPIQQLASIETGLFFPDRQKVADIAKALDLKKEELTKVMPPPVTPPPPPVPDQPKPISADVRQSLIGTYPHDDIQTGEDFAHFIRFLRMRKGKKQLQVAKHLGMPYPAEISKVERGLYAGPVYSRYEALAEFLEFPVESMKKIIDRVVSNMGHAPSKAYRDKPHTAKPTRPYVAPIVQPTPEPIPVSPIRAEPVPAPVRTEPVRQAIPLDKLLTAIREQAEQTRDLLCSQHQELIEVLKKLTPAEANPADVLHALVDNLFKK